VERHSKTPIITASPKETTMLRRNGYGPQLWLIAIALVGILIALVMRLDGSKPPRKTAPSEPSGFVLEIDPKEAEAATQRLKESSQR
jgi:hypothetical protein